MVLFYCLCSVKILHTSNHVAVSKIFRYYCEKQSTKILFLAVFELCLNFTSISLVPDNQKHNLEMLSITHENSFPKFIQTVSLSNYVARCLSITRVSFMIQIKSPKGYNMLSFLICSSVFHVFILSENFQLLLLSLKYFWSHNYFSCMVTWNSDAFKG